MEQVVSTPELLEAIILNLSIQDALVNAMRVNHTWHSTIKSSPRLQQHLFLAPTSPSATQNCEWRKNPLLAEKFPAWFCQLEITLPD
jgi:hypothetical protein